MKYFKLNPTYIKKINGSGEYSQTSRMYGKYDYESDDSVWNFTKKERVSLPTLAPFLLNRDALLTDLISAEQINSTQAIIIKNRFSDFLSDYKLPEFISNNVELAYSSAGIIENYILFIVTENSYYGIDFLNSAFKVASSIEKINQSISISDESTLINVSEILKEEAWHKKVVFEKLVLKDGFNLDIFRLGIFGGLYISERLKDAIENKGFTGMEFKLMEHIVKEDNKRAITKNKNNSE